MAAVALLLIGGGLAWLADMLDVVDVGPRTAVGAGLVLLGAALVLAGWRGRARALVPIGLLAVAAVLAVEVIDVPLDAGTGDRTVVVDGPGELRDRYELTAGDFEIDLRDAPLPRRRTTAVDAALGVGTMRVVVPDRVTARVHAHLRVGGLRGDLPDGTEQEGMPVDETFTLPGAEGGPRLALTLDVGVGDLEVTRG